MAAYPGKSPSVQRFGHTRTHCRGRPTCSICASTDHIGDECDADTPRCVNCGDEQSPHTSFDRSCPAYAREKEINMIKTTRNISFREARELYNESHPKTSYARKVQTSGTPKTLEQMSAPQLVQLLKSFGLVVVAAGAGARGTEASGPSIPVAPAQTSPISGDDPVAASAAAGEGDDGWTLVQRRRAAGRRDASPPQPAPTGRDLAPPTASHPPAKESAVMAALRRNEEEKRLRDARRARLAERAREARRSPGTEEVTGAAQGGTGSVPPSPGGPAGRPRTASHPAGGPSPMGPPAQPQPPSQRPRVPPPPLPAAPPSGERPPGTPRSAPRPLEPPPAPARLGKRGIAWGGSPSEGDTPRTRHKPQSLSGGGRSSSADGRLLQRDAAHPRVSFGDGAPKR